MYKCECGATYSKKENIICRKCHTTTSRDINKTNRIQLLSPQMAYRVTSTSEATKPILQTKKVKFFDHSNIIKGDDTNG